MSAEEFLQHAFGKDADEEKLEHFEQSTLKLLLQRTGWTKAQIAQEVQELGPAFNSEWFNDQAILAFPLFVDRCFHFNLQELLSKPLQCKLLQQFHERWKDEDEIDMAVVFKTYNFGRIVVSRGITTEASSKPTFPCVLTAAAPGLLVQVQPWAVFCNYHFSGEEDHDV